MSYGKIKADTLTYDDGSGDVNISVSGIPTSTDLAAKADTSTVNTQLADKAPVASPSFTGTPVVQGDGSSTDGQIQLNCSQNSHGVKIKSPPHSANASYTLVLPNDTGTNGYALTTDGAGVTSWGQLPTVDPDTAVTDAAQTFTAAQRGYINSFGNSSGTPTAMDFDVANNFSYVLTGNITISNPTNPAAGQTGSIFLVQDGTGSRTAAWGSYWDFAGGTAPTLTTTAAGVDRVDYVVRSATSIQAVFTGNYS